MLIKSSQYFTPSQGKKTMNWHLEQISECKYFYNTAAKILLSLHLLTEKDK